MTQGFHPLFAIIRPVLAALSVAVVALLVTNQPVSAAPARQNSLPDFTLNAQTTISVTVAISDGQVIVIPIELSLAAENLGGEAAMSLLTDFEEQAGIFIGISPTGSFPATLLRPGEQQGDEEEDSASTDAPVQGTHVTNTNSRLRAGPGTNFDIVGRVPQGGAVTVVGQNADGTWLQLEVGSWIAEFLVEPIEPAQNNTNTGEDEEAAAEPVAASEEDNVADEEVVADVEAGPVPPIGNQSESTTYLLEISAIGTRATASLNILTQLVAEPAPLSSQWRDSVAVQLNVLSVALDEFLGLTPVAGYEDVQAQMTEVALSCEQVIDVLAAGIANPYVVDDAAGQSVEACATQVSTLAATTQAQR